MEAMRDIQTKFTQTRNAEAEAMLSEMLEVDREAVIAEYNAAQDSKVTQVPQDNEKRTSRYMVPLFAWLAKTLGSQRLKTCSSSRCKPVRFRSNRTGMAVRPSTAALPWRQPGCLSQFCLAD
jgi:hypothetical protein